MSRKMGKVSKGWKYELNACQSLSKGEKYWVSKFRKIIATNFKVVLDKSVIQIKNTINII